MQGLYFLTSFRQLFCLRNLALYSQLSDFLGTVLLFLFLINWHLRNFLSLLCRLFTIFAWCLFLLWLYDLLLTLLLLHNWDWLFHLDHIIWYILCRRFCFLYLFCWFLFLFTIFSCFTTLYIACCNIFQWLLYSIFPSLKLIKQVLKLLFIKVLRILQVIIYPLVEIVFKLQNFGLVLRILYLL